MEQVKILIDGKGSCLCTFYHNGIANVMIIDNVWVDEEHRGQGIGTEVMRRAMKLAKDKDIDAVELVVSEDNHIAKRMYRNFDFKKTNKEHHRVIIRSWTNG